MKLLAVALAVHADRASERYERIRLAVFSPEYLRAHTQFDEADFTALIEGIVAFQENIESNKRALKELLKVNGDLFQQRAILLSTLTALLIEPTALHGFDALEMAREAVSKVTK